jgi:isopenicillin-N N-acyltransferase-like protein
MEHRRLRKIILTGDPDACGRQYGEKARDLIRRSIAIYQQAFYDAAQVSWDQVLDFAKTFLKGIEKFDGTLVEEMKGMAQGAGVAFEEILAINLRTEILFGLRQRRIPEGCTAFCALPEITANGHTILAQNWDYKPFAAETVMLLQIQPKGAPEILTLVEAGQFARMGMNSAGHGFCNNYIQCETDGQNMERGIPTPFIRRKALRQGKYYEVLAAIIHSPRSFSGNYLVATADGDGDAINIEATAQTAYFLYPQNGLVVHSNHLKGAGPGYVGAMRQGVENSIYRDRRLETLLRRKAGRIGPEVAKEAFQDHFGYPYSICRHPDEKKRSVDQWRTNASVIMDLTAKVMWVAAGPPCQFAYERYGFDPNES